MNERLRRHTVRTGFVAIFSLFVAGTSLNAAPSMIEPFAGALCPGGTHLEVGHRSLPGSRGGSAGFARCIGADGRDERDVFATAFFTLWGTLLVGLTLVVAAGAELREHRAAAR